MTTTQTDRPTTVALMTGRKVEIDTTVARDVEADLVALELVEESITLDDALEAYHHGVDTPVSGDAITTL